MNNKMNNKSPIHIAIDALQEIARWDQETNDRALRDPQVATSLWRGSVAWARQALSDIEEASHYVTISSYHEIQGILSKPPATKEKAPRVEVHERAIKEIMDIISKLPPARTTKL